MLTVTFAFVVATALFFLFRQTRWMGVVGVFVLLCISPLFFGGLLLLVGVAYYLFFRRRIFPIVPQSHNLLPDEAGRRTRNTFLPLLALVVGGALALGYSEPTSESAVSQIIGAVRSAPRDEVLVLRTPGGLLEVSRIQTTEVFDATVRHTILGVDIGETMPRIRVPAVYRYHVELEPEWRVVRSDGVFTLVAPTDEAEPAGRRGLRGHAEGRGRSLDPPAVHEHQGPEHAGAQHHREARAEGEEPRLHRPAA